VKKEEIKRRIVPAAAAFVLLLLFSARAAQADELSDLKQQMDTTMKLLQEMQERITQLEARQTLKEKSLTEQIEAIAKKTEEIEKAAPAGLPTSASWVERIKWSGDFRYRHESIDEETAGSVRWKAGQNRHRIRARLMLEATLNDEWGLGFRLASGSADPTSTNQTLDSSFSSKDIWLDLAYFDYHPAAVKGLNVYGGKIKNPFYMVGGNQLIFDGDLNPEGIGFTFERALNERDTLRLAGGGFWVDEGSGSAADPSLFGAQAMITHTRAMGVCRLPGAAPAFWATAIRAASRPSIRMIMTYSRSSASTPRNAAPPRLASSATGFRTSMQPRTRIRAG